MKVEVDTIFHNSSMLNLQNFISTNHKTTCRLFESIYMNL